MEIIRTGYWLGKYGLEIEVTISYEKGILKTRKIRSFQKEDGQPSIITHYVFVK